MKRAWLGLLLVCLVAAQEGDIGNFRRVQRRSLLQSDSKLTAEEKREAKRERQAMKAFEQEQKRKAEESSGIIKRASKTAEDTVRQYIDGNFKQRLELLVDLLRNADGVAFKFTINTLMNRGKNKAVFVKRNANRAIGQAIREGFATNVAEVFAYAFTIKRNDKDHNNLLEILMYRQQKLNKKGKGRGCLFVKNLLADADLLAHDRGDSFVFVSSFDSEEYLPLMECFLEECTGASAKCCKNEKILRKGLCGCSKKDSNRCDFNIFSNQPRPIWVCSKEECEPNQKCLCAAKQ